MIRVSLHNSATIGDRALPVFYNPPPPLEQLPAGKASRLTAKPTLSRITNDEVRQLKPPKNSNAC